jgi:hypothetical protein
MTDIALTATQIALVYPQEAEVFDYIAGVALTAGQPVYLAATGKVSPADGNGSGTTKVRGIALQTVGAGQAVSVVKRGHLYGFTISGLAYDAVVYLSDTAGKLADAPSATTPARIGRVVPLPDNSLTKVLYVDCSWESEPGASMRVFVSAEVTANGSAQNTAHGLGVIPFAVLAIPTDTTPTTAGEFTVAAGSHDATNCVFTVTTGKKYKVIAFAA